MQNKTEKSNLSDKINDFVQRNRKGIFTVTGIIIFLFAAFVVYLSVSDYLNKKNIAEVEELSRRYEEMRYYLRDDSSASGIEVLISDLKNFAGNKKGFPAGRAWSIVAYIHAGREEWPQCEDAWQRAAAAGDKTYLGPIALFNAAAAAQEQGKFEQAIVYLKECVEHKFEFPSAPRAQFSIGSLYERLGNYPEAVDAYRVVIINWPDLPVWQQLARSRITAIEVR
jgi:tetratricopeptide (TPR) repeat protein